MTDTIPQVEKQVRETLESGADIYRRVRTITLKALTERELDTDNIKSVVEAVFNGISAGISAQYEPAKEAFKQSADAVDDALKKTAEASRLALEEAVSSAGEFSRHDLKQATEDLKSLENLFLETMEKMARESNEAVSGIAGDFISHARQNGTAVGKEAQHVLETLNNLRHRGQDAVLISAAATTSTLAKIAGGILAGIAESLNPDKPNN
jgi:hypothetical protein